jgi:hypothetical protein
VFANDTEIQELLGREFSSALAKIEQTANEAKSLVITAAIAVLLQLKFQLCEDLWLLVVHKAHAYVDRSTIGFGTPKDLYDIATQHLQNVQIQRNRTWCPVSERRRYGDPLIASRSSPPIEHSRRTLRRKFYMRDPQDRDECKREANSMKRGTTEDRMDRDVQMGYDPVDDWLIAPFCHEKCLGKQQPHN